MKKNGSSKILDPFLRNISFIPLFAGSKTPTSKFGEYEAVWWVNTRKSPIGKD
ncbi:hypothetical protein RVY75_14205 [Bacillus mycoides]|uniref:hypothetical protein n=1 Tax=Bacillus TaxID=1386 RepID=UPI000316EF1C|nr:MULTISPECIES: hypothetical protein [Bacillus]MBK5429387.1 hypothetical protein [Bacillus sp. TH30]WOA61241.1 hypothetical protein RVY75_14205 [Bacillus mycoides]